MTTDANTTDVKLAEPLKKEVNTANKLVNRLKSAIGATNKRKPTAISSYLDYINLIAQINAGESDTSNHHITDIIIPRSSINPTTPSQDLHKVGINDKKITGMQIQHSILPLSLEKCLYVRGSISDTKIIKSAFINTAFEHTVIQDTTFEDCFFMGVDFDQILCDGLWSCKGIRFENCQFVNCNMTDPQSVMFNCVFKRIPESTNEVTRHYAIQNAQNIITQNDVRTPFVEVIFQDLDTYILNNKDSDNGKRFFRSLMLKCTHKNLNLRYNQSFARLTVAIAKLALLTAEANGGFLPINTVIQQINAMYYEVGQFKDFVSIKKDDSEQVADLKSSIQRFLWHDLLGQDGVVNGKDYINFDVLMDKTRSNTLRRQFKKILDDVRYIYDSFDDGNTDLSSHRKDQTMENMKLMIHEIKNL